MQVNMPENMPGPAFERTTTKPAETDTTGAPTPFFAQIGQIMNPDRERPEDKTDEANARQAPVQSNSESRGVRRNPSVSSKGSVKAEQVPTNEKTGTESRMSRIGNSAAAAIRILNQARIAKSNSDVTVRETPVETRPLSQIRNGSDSKNIQNESKNVFSDSNAVSGRNLKESITQSEGFKTGSLFKPDSAAKPKLPLDSNIIQTKPVKTESGSAADARVFPDRNSQDESSNPIILRKPGVTLTAQLPRRNAAVAQAARNQSSKAPVEPQAPDAARMTQPGSRREAGIRSGSASVLEEPVFADNLQTVRNIRVSNDNSHTVAAKKPDNTKTSAIENANTGNSNSGQNAGHNESASWTILQNNLGSSRADSGFGKTSSADPQQDFVSQLISSHTRMTDSGSLKTSGEGQIAAEKSNEFLFQLAERIQFHAREGGGHLRIQLKPDSLGRLLISAETTTSGVIARIMTESHNVKAYLENNLHVLQQTLQDNGLKVDRIHVAVQENFNPQSSSGNTAQSSHSGSEHSEENPGNFTGVADATPENPLEEMTIDAQTWLAVHPNSRFHTVA